MYVYIYELEVLERKNRIAPNTQDTAGGNWVDEEDNLHLYPPLWLSLIYLLQILFCPSKFH